MLSRIVLTVVKEVVPMSLVLALSGPTGSRKHFRIADDYEQLAKRTEQRLPELLDPATEKN
jgi:hypothetical protein